MIVKLTDENFTAEVYEDATYGLGRPVIVSFGSPSCRPCQAQAITLDLLNERFGFKVCKAMIEDAPHAVAHFNVPSIPYTLFFAGGEPHLAYNGVANLTQLRKLVGEAVEMAAGLKAA